MMKTRGMGSFVGIALMGLLVSLPGLASAQLSHQQEFGMMRKLFRGMANAATGWMEIPLKISETWNEKGPVMGFTEGLFKGVGYAAARSAAGGYEIGTFPIPVPEHYTPVIEPEFVITAQPSVEFLEEAERAEETADR